MRRWLRRIRGAIGIGVTWAAGWAPVGAVVGSITGIVLGFPLGVVATNYAALFGVLGFVGGTIFSTVVRIAEGRRRFDQLGVAETKRGSRSCGTDRRGGTPAAREHGMTPRRPDDGSIRKSGMKAGSGLGRSIALVCGVMLVFASTGCREAIPDDPAGTWEMGPFTRYDGNPILTPRGETWEAKDVFNPAAWTDGETVWLLYRAEDTTGAGRWNGTSRIGLAHSFDGFRFEREPEPVLVPTEEWELPGGCEDPRVVKIGDTFYLTYTAYDGETARLALASSSDLRSWTKHGLVFPDRGWTKSGAILATPIRGTYWMFFGDTDVWAAYSTDLLDWSVVEEPVLRPRPGYFDERLVEPGPQPLLTDRGILLLYNAADSALVYRAGQALFDPDDPTRLLARSDEPFLTPTTTLEQTGQVPNVVFAQGLVDYRDRWFLYFGMGDSGIGAATLTGGRQAGRPGR